MSLDVWLIAKRSLGSTVSPYHVLRTERPAVAASPMPNVLKAGR
jgi:hypothetical protein